MLLRQSALSVSSIATRSAKKSLPRHLSAPGQSSAFSRFIMPSSSTSKVAVCQIRSTNDPAHNLNISCNVIREAVASGATVSLEPCSTVCSVAERPTGMLPPGSSRLHRDLCRGVSRAIVSSVKAPIHARIKRSCQRTRRGHFCWSARDTGR
jgi:hypothetical protein